MTDYLKRELLPCPFCGGEPFMEPFDGYITVICKTCGADGPDGCVEEETAAFTWNRRALPSQSIPQEGEGEGERLFPMLRGRPSISWATARQVYAVYSALYGDRQSLECMAERGGLGWSEVDVIFEDYIRQHGPAALHVLLARASLKPERQ